MVTQTADNRFGMPTFIVHTDPAKGTHTTLTTAMADASLGDTIGIKEITTFTEDVVLKGGTIVYSMVPLSAGLKPKIKGKLSIASGTALIEGLTCETNGDYAAEMTSTGTIEANDCDFIATDHDGVNFAGNNCSWNRVTFDVTAATYRGFVSSASTVRLRRFGGGNSGLTSATCLCSDGNVVMEWGGLPLPLETSGSGQFLLYSSQINTNNTNLVALTTAGTGTSKLNNCLLETGSVASISVGSGTTVECTNLTIDSTNSNPITGAGTVRYGSVDFVNSGQGENVTTHTRRPVAVGSISFDGNTNKLEAYEEGTFTPTVIGTSTAGTASYSVQIGNYTRIGREVLFRIAVVWSGGTGTGNLRIDGLPFTINTNNGNCAIPCNPASTIAVTSGYNQVTAFTAANSTQIAITEVDFNTASGALPYDAAGSITFSGSYYF